MNNSKLAIENISLTVEEPVDRKPYLREREGTLVKLLDAVRKVESSKEWGTLKTELFDALVNTLTRDLSTEAKKEDPDTLKLNRLAGQLKWAEKYSDLKKLEDTFRLELTQVRKYLYGTTKESNGE